MAAAVWMSRAEKKTLIRNSISEPFCSFGAELSSRFNFSAEAKCRIE